VICHQNEEQELENVAKYFKQHPNSSQIHLINIHYQEAKGPLFARYLIQQMCQKLNQECPHQYFLSIDSHTRFIERYDANLIHQFNMCENEKAVLSCYSGEYQIFMDQDIIKTQFLPNYLFADKFDSDVAFCWYHIKTNAATLLQLVFILDQHLSYTIVFYQTTTTFCFSVKNC
jgi:hypothetical protein